MVDYTLFEIIEVYWIFHQSGSITPGLSDRGKTPMTYTQIVCELESENDQRYLTTS